VGNEHEVSAAASPVIGCQPMVGPVIAIRRGPLTHPVAGIRDLSPPSSGTGGPRLSFLVRIAGGDDRGVTTPPVAERPLVTG
jgi:hypothetical protein